MMVISREEFSGAIAQIIGEDNQTNDPKILLVVVLYGRPVAASETITSLSGIAEASGPNVVTVIWNNGPELIIDPGPCKLNGIVVNTTLNISLGEIYNTCLREWKYFDLFVTYDQDTEVSPILFQCLKNAWLEQLDTLAVPITYQNGLIVSPVDKSYRPIPHLEPGLFDGNAKTAIGSGMIIPKRLASEASFTEKLRLYGVDYHFFRQTAKHKKILLLPLSQKHSLATRTGSVFKEPRRAQSLIHSLYFNQSLEVGSIRAFLCTLRFIVAESLKSGNPLHLFRYLSLLIKIATGQDI